MDGWDVFGDAPPGDAPALPHGLGVKRARDEELVAMALECFRDDGGEEIEVPPPPPPPPPSADACEAHAGALAVWPEHPPAALGPLALARVPSFGGLRGLVASRAVRPGEVLMTEAPLVRWPEPSERKPLALLQHVLTAPPSRRALCLRAMARLHPCALEADVPASMRERLAEDHRADVDALLPLWAADCLEAGLEPSPEPGAGDKAAGGTDGDASLALRRASLLRLCLTVRWNAFDSGLFLHQALFNHAPSRHANCDKASVTLHGGKTYSVIRACRPIAAGEQCLITYLQPPELSAASSKARLTQFDFAVAFERDTDGLDRPPSRPRPSPASADADAADADALTCSLEDDAQAALRSALRLRSAAAAAEAAEAAIGALVAACGPRHLAVASARRALVDGLRRRLREGSAEGEAELLLLLLSHAVELWYTQRRLLGPLHPECATTMHDIGTSITRLLGLAPAALFRRFPRWGSPALASRAEAKALALHRAVAALYDADAALPRQAPTEP